MSGGSTPSLYSEHRFESPSVDEAIFASILIEPCGEYYCSCKVPYRAHLMALQSILEPIPTGSKSLVPPHSARHAAVRTGFVNQSHKTEANITAQGAMAGKRSSALSILALVVDGSMTFRIGYGRRVGAWPAR